MASKTQKIRKMMNFAPYSSVIIADLSFADGILNLSIFLGG